MSHGVLELSPYRVSIFRQCPRRYKYHYIDGLRDRYFRPTPAITMGANLHRTLDRFFSGANRDRSYAAAERMLRDAWSRDRKGFAGPDEEREWGRRALDQLRWLFETQDVTARPFMREAVHKTPLAPGLRLMGRVDRVDRIDDGSLHVIDYKSGNYPGPAEDYQLRWYALLLRRRTGLCVSRASYLFLNGTGWQSIEPTDGDLTSAEEEALEAGEEIRAEASWAPRLSGGCGRCEFTRLCDSDLPGEAHEPS